jgi:hypothetical protein
MVSRGGLMAAFFFTDVLRCVVTLRSDVSLR